MPVFNMQLAKRLYSSRFHSSVIVEEETLNGESITVFRSNKRLPELIIQVEEYFTDHIEIIEHSINENETVVKFKILN